MHNQARKPGYPLTGASGAVALGCRYCVRLAIAAKGRRAITIDAIVGDEDEVERYVQRGYSAIAYACACAEAEETVEAKIGLSADSIVDGRVVRTTQLVGRVGRVRVDVFRATRWAVMQIFLGRV
jgi:hypothetical protein